MRPECLQSRVDARLGAVDAVLDGRLEPLVEVIGDVAFVVDAVEPARFRLAPFSCANPEHRHHNNDGFPVTATTPTDRIGGH